MTTRIVVTEFAADGLMCMKHGPGSFVVEKHPTDHWYDEAVMSFRVVAVCAQCRLEYLRGALGGEGRPDDWIAGWKRELAELEGLLEEEQ